MPEPHQEHRKTPVEISRNSARTGHYAVLFYAVVDRIIDHLKLTFVADKPPPPHLAHQEVLVAAGTTMVVVCHAIEPLAGLATRALTVREGSIAIRDELPAAPEARLRFLDALARGKA
jgi:hypothetical protein